MAVEHNSGLEHTYWKGYKLGWLLGDLHILYSPNSVGPDWEQQHLLDGYRSGLQNKMQRAKSQVCLPDYSIGKPLPMPVEALQTQEDWHAFAEGLSLHEPPKESDQIPAYQLGFWVSLHTALPDRNEWSTVGIPRNYSQYAAFKDGKTGTDYDSWLLKHSIMMKGANINGSNGNNSPHYDEQICWYTGNWVRQELQ